MLTAAVWLYNGLWLKLLSPDAHHLEIVRATGGPFGWSPERFLRAIGAGETLLALAILSGVWPRFVNGSAVALLLAMNLVGIVQGGGTIHDPVGLLVGNGPLVLCGLLLAAHGPGPGTWTVRRLR